MPGAEATAGTQTVYVRLEGDRGLPEELLGRAWGVAAAGDPLEALLGLLAEKALRRSIHLAVGELKPGSRGATAPAGRPG